MCFKKIIRSIVLPGLVGYGISCGGNGEVGWAQTPTTPPTVSPSPAASPAATPSPTSPTAPVSPAAIPSPEDASDPEDVNLLKSGDRLNVTVLGFPDLSGEQMVLADGTIQMPLVGSVSVRGLTPAQASTQLTEALRPYVRRPQVNISLLNIRPPRVSVTGEVRRPGPLVITPPNNSSPTSPAAPNMQPVDVAGGELYTLSYALVLAGGLTPNADLRNIVIRREAPASQPGTSDSGKTEIRVNLWQILRSGNLSSDLRLQDGDEIVVPTASLNTADQQQLLSSSLAPTTISVQVAGEVNSPGQITIAPNADVNMAVAAAGGPARGAARNRIRLLRMAPNGQLEQQNFRFGEESVTLREGDVIVIERRGSQRFLDVVGQVLNPLNFLNFLF